MTAAGNLPRTTSLIFGVPLFVDRVTDPAALNAGLRRIILEQESRDQGVKKSNLGGWHSEPTLLQWPAPEIDHFRKVIDHAVQSIGRFPAGDKADRIKLAYEPSAWAIVNRDGHYNGIHCHTGYHWAVVYYVDIGQPAPGHPQNGQIELHDPRPAAIHGRVPGFMFGRSVMIPPKPGMVIAFPAWIQHSVHPFRGTGERISIAVNVKLTEFDSPSGERL